MNVDDGAEKTPRSCLPVDVKHAQDLKKSNASNSRRGEHLTVAADGDNDRRRYYDKNVNEANGLASELEAASPAHIFAATSSRPQSNAIFDAKKYDQYDFHVEEDFVGIFRIVVYCGQNAKY